jgi:nucleotide-binding universal stress UspA family protein
MPVLQQAVSLSIENILLATDFSVASEKAGAYAKALAKRFGSALEIAHVFDTSVVTSYEEAIVTMTSIDRKKIADENLEAFVRGLSLESVPTQLISSEDHNPSAELLRIATEGRADLIVTGTEGKSGLSRLILGSTAEQLVRWAACPVLTVGPKAQTPEPGPLEFKTILYATDFSTEAAKASAYALSFAQDSAATLYCCSVLTSNDEGPRTRTELTLAFEHKLESLIPKEAYDWCTPKFVVGYGETASALLKIAEEHHVDLIVLGARRSSFWLRHVGGGLTPELLAEAKCPVLTIS